MALAFDLELPPVDTAPVPEIAVTLLAVHYGYERPRWAS